jgi:hypothetical protein
LVSFIKGDAAYMKSLAHIPEIVKNMQYLETMKNPEWKNESGEENKGYASFDYYITPVKMDGKNYTILSETGKASNGDFYYYQNVFEGALPEVMHKAKSLLNRSPDSGAGATKQASTNKYNKFLEIMQGIYGKNFEKAPELEKKDSPNQNIEETEARDLHNRVPTAEAGAVTQASTSKYTKNSGEKQGESEKNIENEAEYLNDKGKELKAAKLLNVPAKTKPNSGVVRKPESEWGKELSAKEKAKSWLRNKFDAFITSEQDRFRTAKLLNSIAPNMPDDANFHRDLELMPGKIDHEIDKHVKPIIEKMAGIIAKRGIKPEDADLFVYATVAPRINKYVRENVDENNPAGSGITDEDAKRILLDMGYGVDNQQLKQIRELNRELNKWAYGYGVENDLWSQAQVDKWVKLYGYDYVPLKGLESEAVEKLFGMHDYAIKKGVQPQKGTKTRGGRITMAKSVLAQNFADKIALIANAERNKAMLAFEKIEIGRAHV